jgi:hypothetical protein
MVMAPVPRAVTTPEELTLATDGFEDPQVMATFKG